MAKYQKKEKTEKESKGNILADPEIRKKFKSSLALITKYFEDIDKFKEGMAETIEALSGEYGLDKKTIRKLATTMYKCNYGSLMEENRHFEVLYETVIEGKLRDPDAHLSPDPLEEDNE